MQLLQSYLRAAELEMRAAEEPLSSDLDVAWLKAQVLGRVEELEAREQEREEMLTEIVPAMESRGYDTEAIKAVMGAREPSLPGILNHYAVAQHIGLSTVRRPEGEPPRLSR